MSELLDRAEIPMQAIDDRDQDISAIVPVHLGVLALPAEVKRDILDVGEATKTVAEWYDEDMNAYLLSLARRGYTLPHLRGYEEFRPDWRLDAEPTGEFTEFLTLIWQEDGMEHKLVHDPITQPLYNQHDEDGNFYVPDTWRARDEFPLIYRRVIDPVILFMQPDKMKQFGNEVPELHAVIDPMGGVAEVLGTTFNSDYQSNLAKALLLRNYGVYYMNQMITLLK